MKQDDDGRTAAYSSSLSSVTLTPMNQQNQGHGIFLPPDIMAIILNYADRPTIYQVLRTCKEYHDVAVPRLYRHVEISTPRQLRSFMRTVAKARSDATLARPLFFINSFSYKIGAGHLTSSLDSKNRRLYAALGEIPGYGTSGSSDTSDWLFPNLKTANFEPLPACDFSFLPANTRTGTEIRTTTTTTTTTTSTSFLSHVTKVNLLHSRYSNYDKPPHFRSLGMTNITRLVIYHLFGAEILSSTSVDLKDYLGYQQKLERVVFRLGKHFGYTLGETSDEDDDGEREDEDGLGLGNETSDGDQNALSSRAGDGTQAGSSITTSREAESGPDESSDLDTEDNDRHSHRRSGSAEHESSLSQSSNGYYIYEYGTSIASTVWNLINSRQRLFPALRTLVVVLGDESYHDLLVVGSAKERIYAMRMETLALNEDGEGESMPLPLGDEGLAGENDDDDDAISLVIKSGRDTWIYDFTARPQEGEDFYRYKTAWRHEKRDEDDVVVDDEDEDEDDEEEEEQEAR